MPEPPHASAPAGRSAPPPTLEAVAAHAGVSRATVSRVVNGSPTVRAELRERVERSVAALGYVPNSAARALVTRRTGAVAVVIAEPESRVFTDPFFAQQLRGISHELAAHDTQLVLLLVERRSDYARIGRYLTARHVDGALMFSLHAEDPLPVMARSAGLPTVFGGRPGWSRAADDPELLYVDTDNRDGARQAVAHLRERGRRRIGVITGPLEMTAAEDRLAGYRDALAPPAPPGGAAEQAGRVDPAARRAGSARSGGSAGSLAELVAHGDFTPGSGERAMAALLDRCPDLDAVFASNDLMATGALRALRARGRRVPRDVAVVGYDDLEPARWADPPLTTVRQDVRRMGELMAGLLLARLGQRAVPAAEAPTGPLAPIVTPARLVVRQSS